jgi:transglutaminase-like putative cysteine protease
MPWRGWPCLVAVASLATPAHAGTRLRTTPAPAWVKKLAPELSPASPGQGRRGIETLLEDIQLHLGSQHARYVHFADRVTESEGLDVVSPLRIDYDPSYQQLLVHFLSARRGSQVIDLLRQAAVKTIDLEGDLDRRRFDGRRSLVIVPHDLRVGDVVEAAFTIVGSNPVFGRHSIGNVVLGVGRPVHRRYSRLVMTGATSPLSIRLRAKASPPAQRTIAGTTEYVWDQADPPQVEYEGREPAWFESDPLAQFSDFDSWDAVREWALPLYPPRPPTPAMAERVAEWRRASDGAEERALAALRFVQDDVRYLGFELGPNSHAPHTPELVLAQRFGDCKDKSYLLVTLLRALGIDADPALVDATPGQRVADSIPSPFAFDHVIVRATIGGRVYWLDPTLSQQGGTLEIQSTPRYGHALVLRAGSKGLEAIPEDRVEEPLVTLNERYQIGADGGASLEVETVYRQSAADQTRARFLHAQPKDLSQRFVNFYAKRHPSISVVRSPQVTDDRRRNRLVLHETYAIAKFWHDNEIWLRGYLVDDELQAPGVRLRKNPLALSYPVHVQHNIEVLLPTVFNIERFDDKIERSGLALRRVVERSGRLVAMHYTLRTTAPHVAAADVPAYLKALEEVSAALDYHFTLHDGVRREKDQDALGGLLALVLLIGVPFGAAIGIGLYGRHRRRVVRRRYQPMPGETASVAIELGAAQEAMAAGERLRCSCGGRLGRPPSAELDTSRLDDQVIHSARFRCDRCARDRPVYFKLRPS